ncbi:MAG: hypothetical protein KAU10_02480, partial [Dehalococcoidia bacterium]|nr:hypothetical protein [Dehalococcoidia bacterium]
KEKGLIVRAKKERIRKRDIVGYLVKYVASPPIALSRIEEYDNCSAGILVHCGEEVLRLGERILTVPWQLFAASLG